VQLDPMNPKLKPPGTKHLNLLHYDPRSNCAFKFSLRRYHEAALGSERASSALNAGQSVILALGWTAVLAAASLGLGRGGLEAVGSVSGRVGDLVMANGQGLTLVPISDHPEPFLSQNSP